MRSFLVSSKAPRILIVDDISQNVDLVRSLMRAEGYQVTSAVNGLEALERGGVLHDLGKIGIPDAVLLKPAGPTEPASQYLMSRWLTNEHRSPSPPHLCPLPPVGGEEFLLVAPSPLGRGGWVRGSSEQ